jgi:hypothetical protein
MKTLMALPLINCFVDAFEADNKCNGDYFTIEGKQLHEGIMYIWHNMGVMVMWIPEMEGGC